jgi:hypothetical protein
MSRKLSKKEEKIRWRCGWSNYRIHFVTDKSQRYVQSNNGGTRTQMKTLQIPLPFFKLI